MNKDESPIHSTNVTLGSSKPASGASFRAKREPWDILICSDLGYISGKPERIAAATLNELITTNTVVISGNVTENLPADIPQFHIEYRISDIKDLAAAALSSRLPLLQDLRNASQLLDEIARNRVSAPEGFRRIALMALPQSIVRKLGAVIPEGHTPAKSAGAASKVDSILSMMDIADAPSGASEPVKSTPTDFVAALTGAAAAQREFSPSAVLSCKESIDALIEELSVTIARQPFFRGAAASWNGVKTLLKAVGRNRDINVFVHSAPYDAAQRHFADALGGCGSASGAPDLAIWDYPVSTDTATMQQLEHVADAAERYKCTVVASLDRGDDLYKKIIGQEPLRQALEQPGFIPLRRLQAAESSRCLALCAPDAFVQRASGEQEMPVAGAWLLALQWITSIIENNAPFHLQNSSVMALDNFGFPKLSAETVSEANQCGITLLRPGSTTMPRVLLADHRSPYGHLLFNLLVNRTARLAAAWIGAQDRSVPCEEAAPELARMLRAELGSYDILSSDDALDVAVDGATLQVTVNSTVTVAGFAVQFQFSFSYRE